MTRERSISSPWLRLVLLCGLGALLAIYAWWPMFAQYPHTPEEDGRYFYHQFEIAKAAVRIYGELPLWNAFDCRGIPLWEFPENMTASPLVLVTARLDTMVTILLWSGLHVVAGFVGMWLLVRDELALSRKAAFAGAAMFALAVCHTTQYAGEHLTFVSFLDAPLLVYLWRRAERDVDYALGTGILLTFMLFNGATYPLPYSCMMLVIETATRLTSRERALRIARAAAVMGASTLLLSACRLLPLVAELAAHDRNLGGETDHLSLKSIWWMFTLRTPQWRATFNGQNYVFGEYMAYIGYFGLAIALLGFVLGIAEYPWLVVLAVGLGTLMAGHFASWAPWSLLHKYVFPFPNMRVPSRFRLLEMMCIAAFVAVAIDRVPVRLRRLGASRGLSQAAGLVVLGLALVGIGDAVGLGLEIHTFRWNGPPAAKLERAPRFYYGGPGLAHDFADQPRQNRAWLGCRGYEWAWRADAPLWQGDVAQAKVVGEGATIEDVRRTHNTFTIDVTTDRPTRLLLNSAFAPAWRTTVGTTIETAEKMLAVDVPAGHHHVFVKYWPKYLTLGFVLSGLGVVVVTAVFARRRLLGLVARVRGARPSDPAAPSEDASS